MAASNATRRLVLHFDINETIIVEDVVSGLDFHSALNNMLAKTALVRVGGAGRLEGCTWQDGSPLDLSKRAPAAAAPPLHTTFGIPEGYEQYWSVFRRDANHDPKKFTEDGQPGFVHRTVFEDLRDRLAWTHAENRVLAPTGVHFVLPAFFRTLAELARRGREFSLVLRTFGPDQSAVARCISAFADGLHPDFPVPGEPDADLAISRLRMAASDAQWLLLRADRRTLSSEILARRLQSDVITRGCADDLGGPWWGDGEEPVADEQVEGEAALDAMLSTRPATGMRDDYHFWRSNGYQPEAGKPLWITLDDPSTHPIFFDDNVHDDSKDSIVCVRARASKGDVFRSVPGDRLRLLQGVFQVKAFATEAILNPDYFLEKIAECEDNFARMLADGSLKYLLLGE